MSLSLRAGRFCLARSDMLTYSLIRFPVSSSYFCTEAQQDRDNERMLLNVKTMKRLVSQKRTCLSMHIEAMIEYLMKYRKTYDVDRISLMKACSMDVSDIFPKQQKQLTLEGYDTAKKIITLDTSGSTFYNSSLEAFLYQDVEFEIDDILRDMTDVQVNPDVRTIENMLGYYCKKQDIDSALDILLDQDDDDIEVQLNEKVAAFLIYGHCSRKEYSEAEEILNLVKKRQIPFGRELRNNFVRGAAFCGDIERMNHYISKFKIKGQAASVLLDSLVLIAGSGHEKDILDLLNKEKTKYYAHLYRRSVKQLVERGHLDIAEQLLLKTEEMKENMTVNESYMHISPSVIVVKELLKDMTSPMETLIAVNRIKPVDSMIVERSIALLLDIAFNEPERKSFCQKTIKTMMSDMDLPALKNVERLIDQHIKRRLRSTTNESEVHFIISYTCDLGIRLKEDVWMSIMYRLIPTNSSYTKPQLVKRIGDIRDALDPVCHISGGIYSNSVIWSFITLHALRSARLNEVFFSAIAEHIKIFGVAYGSKRWFDALGQCVVATRDVKSYMSFFQIVYDNCEKRGDGEEYKQVNLSLVAATNLANRTGDNIDDLILKIFKEIRSRNMKLHPVISMKLITVLKNPAIAEEAKKLPVLDNLDYRTIEPPGVTKRRS